MALWAVSCVIKEIKKLLRATLIKRVLMMKRVSAIVHMSVVLEIKRRMIDLCMLRMIQMVSTAIASSGIWIIMT